MLERLRHLHTYPRSSSASWNSGMECWLAEDTSGLKTETSERV